MRTIVPSPLLQSEAHQDSGPREGTIKKMAQVIAARADLC